MIIGETTASVHSNTINVIMRSFELVALVKKEERRDDV